MHFCNQGFLGIPRKFGKLKDTSKFDAEFFRVSPKQAHTMDAQQRILHEVVYECIVDAGMFYSYYVIYYYVVNYCCVPVP